MVRAVAGPAGRPVERVEEVDVPDEPCRKPITRTFDVDHKFDFTGYSTVEATVVTGGCGARTERVPFPEATLAGEPGQTLVLYTDGLVERRGEDIDTGVRRLTEALSRHRHLGVERLADALLGDLTLSDGPCDDVALLIARL